MFKKAIVAAGVGVALSVSQAMAQDTKVEVPSITCTDLNWSAEVLARNPDIGRACQAVYQKDGKLYAKTSVEIVRRRGNTLTFRPLYTDGTKGEAREITVDNDWRATIAGRQYRASDLSRGQELNVYIPEDQFALAAVDEDGPDEADLVVIEDAAPVAMPTTASPLFLFGIAGGAFLALGGVFSALRRRLS